MDEGVRLEIACTGQHPVPRVRIPPPPPEYRTLNKMIYLAEFWSFLSPVSFLLNKIITPLSI